jgi:cadmium resistance protein CadD (predicted permease)
MSELLSHLSVAVVVFVSTNVDDILLIAMLFADRTLAPRAVISGQFLGTGALVAISAVAGVAALAVPEGYIALLGAVPLFLGLHKLWSLKHAGTLDDTDGPEADPMSRQLSTASGIVSVALLTVANGGDNLGVYVPLFARDPRLIVLYSLVFVALTGVWCQLGYTLVNHRRIGERLTRYGRVALPFVLIGLGLWILSGARALLNDV